MKNKYKSPSLLLHILITSPKKRYSVSFRTKAIPIDSLYIFVMILHLPVGVYPAHSNYLLQIYQFKSSKHHHQSTLGKNSYSFHKGRSCFMFSTRGHMPVSTRPLLVVHWSPLVTVLPLCLQIENGLGPINKNESGPLNSFSTFFTSGKLHACYLTFWDDFF